MSWLVRADALIGTLAADPSLRGALDGLSLGIIGVHRKELKLDDMAQTLSMSAEAIDAVLAGRPSFPGRCSPAESRQSRAIYDGSSRCSPGSISAPSSPAALRPMLSGERRPICAWP